MTSDWASYYDGLAADYDAMTVDVDWSVNAVAARLLAPLELAPGRVLDLGAGTGQTALMLRSLFPAAHLTLVEPSRGMLALAEAKVPGARCVQDDAAGFLARAGGGTDLVVALGFLELVPDLFEVLRLAATHLVPGGHLVISHEPLLEAHPVQSRPLSRVDGSLEVHRRRSDDVQRHAAACGLERVASVQETAFERTDGEGGAVYELVVWRSSARPR